MLIYKEKSIFNSVIVIALNYLLLILLLAGLLELDSISLKAIPCIIVLIGSIIGSFLLTRYAVRNTEFRRNEDGKKRGFAIAYFLFDLVFFFLLGLSILVGIEMMGKMRPGFGWFVFVPSLIFAINILFAPNLHPLLFDHILS